MTRTLLILLCLFIGNLDSISQVVINNDNCRKAYNDILSLRFEDAQKRIETEKTINPDNRFIDYLENYIDFLKVTILEDEQLFDKLKDNISIRTKAIDELPDSSPYKYYFLGNIYIQWATVNLRFKNYPTGAFQVNKSYRLITENTKEFPEFYPNKITLGVLHIMIGIVPDSYHWLLNLVAMRGTVTQGRSELISALANCEKDINYKFLTPEILFYMGMIDLSLSPDPEYADYILLKIEDKSKNNLLLTYLKININMKNGNNDDALRSFYEIDSSYNYIPFYYLNFLKGECYLRKLNSKLAMEQFHLYTDNFTGTNYVKDAWLKISWCYLLQGDTNNYFNSIDEIGKNGETNLDADKVAEEVYKNQTIPNTGLLKARLLFDGGYYHKADSVLNTISDKSLTDIELVEKTYRYGRVAQAENRTDDAIEQYITTINSGRSFNSYYAANSALKLGNIFEIQKDTSQAINYYRICLDLEFDQYKNSIKGKAKQGLSRLTK